MQLEIAKIFGIKFGLLDQEQFTNLLIGNEFEGGTFICFVNTFVVTRANEDPELMSILNQSLFCVMDGTPIAWTARMRGLKVSTTISGYWLMRSLLQTSLSHFFYGGMPESLSLLKTKLEEEYPNANIKGFRSPPVIHEKGFDWDSLQDDFSIIKESQADFIWIGISSPKQDYLMLHLSRRLSHGTCLGVGAVFDYMSSAEKKSPEWIKTLGFRWLFRLIQNPRKHFKKYFIYNTKFLIILIKSNFRFSRK